MDISSKPTIQQANKLRTLPPQVSFTNCNCKPTVPIFNDVFYLPGAQPIWYRCRIRAPFEVADASVATFFPVTAGARQDAKFSINNRTVDTFGSVVYFVPIDDVDPEHDFDGITNPGVGGFDIRLLKTCDPAYTDLQVRGFTVANMYMRFALSIERAIEDRLADEGMLQFDADDLTMWDWEEALAASSANDRDYITIRRALRWVEVIFNKVRNEIARDFAITEIPIRDDDPTAWGSPGNEKEQRGMKAGTRERVAFAHKLLKSGKKQCSALRAARTDIRTYFRYCQEVTGEEPIEAYG